MMRFEDAYSLRETCDGIVKNEELAKKSKVLDEASAMETSQASNLRKQRHNLLPKANSENATSQWNRKSSLIEVSNTNQSIEMQL